MASKLVTLAVLLAVATAAPQTYHSAPGHNRFAHVYTESVNAVEENYKSNPEYSFSYEVHDEHTGDMKSHQETRRGDFVEGNYSLVEADGTRRVVEYTVDDRTGFNAVVHKQGVPRTPVFTKHVDAPVSNHS